MSLAEVLPAEPRPTRAETLQKLAAAIRSSAAALEVASDALLLISDEPEPRADPDDPILTVGEVAAMLRRSAAFIRAQCRDGAIKAMQDGRGWRVRRSAVLAYERRRTA